VTTKRADETCPLAYWDIDWISIWFTWLTAYDAAVGFLSTWLSLIN